MASDPTASPCARRRRALLAAVAALLMAAATACTNNNGDIGDWFGAWTLTAIEADGTPLAGYASGTLTWKFQSSVVNMTMVDAHHGCDDRYGTWRQLSAEQLELNFTHSDDDHPAGTGIYAPPEITHLPSDRVAVLLIRHFSAKRLVLDYTAPAGGGDGDGPATTYTYTLCR